MKLRVLLAAGAASLSLLAVCGTQKSAPITCARCEGWGKTVISMGRWAKPISYPCTTCNGTGKV